MINSIGHRPIGPGDISEPGKLKNCTERKRQPAKSGIRNPVISDFFLSHPERSERSNGLARVAFAEVDPSHGSG